MLPLALPVALSAIKALLKYRGRIDDILSLRAATADLPFLLPQPPSNDAPHIENMRAFFRSDPGKLVLELQSMTAKFEAFDADPTLQGFRIELCRLYYQAVDVQPDPLGPGNVPDRGPGAEERLAYYLVSSHRLSRNPAITRILLATADTLLEVAGENAGLFVGNPRLRPVVETLLREFAGKVDFDDSGAQDIFKKLLSAGVVAALENAGRLAKTPALSALVGALAELQKENEGELLAALLGEEGFLRLSGKLLTHVADDPRFLRSHPVAQEAFAAMLKEAGKNLPRLKSDPAAMLGALEAGLVVGSAHVRTLLEPKLDGKPLLAELLGAVSEKVTRLGNDNLLFQEAASGEIFAGIFGTVLETVARDPARLADAAGLKPWVAELVAGTAEIVGRKGLSPDLLKEIGARALRTLSKHPELLAKHHAYACKLLGDVLERAADGFGVDDLIDIGEAALRKAAEQAALREAPDVAQAALSSLLGALSRDGLKELLTPAGRKAALLWGLEAVARNPKTWEALRGKELLQPSTEAVLDALREDPTGLLSGPTLVETLNRVLLVLARRGQVVADKKIAPGALKEILTRALEAAEDELGYGLDAETLPAFLADMTDRFLKTPFVLDGGAPAKMKKLVTAALRSFA